MELRDDFTGKIIKQKRLGQKVREADITGYTEDTLDGYLLMGGYKPASTGLMLVLDCSQTTAWKKKKSGLYSRTELLQIKKRLHLTPEQFCDIFFNDTEGHVKLNNRK